VALSSSFNLLVNGAHRTVEADPDTPLLWVLRDRLELRGTKYGCGIGACGSCTVQVDGGAARSCQMPLREAAGRAITTIEGLSTDGGHPLQRAWLDEDVAQCGFCQPGMILEAAALLRATPCPSDDAIDAAMRDHVCRCGTYLRIRRAIHRAAAEGR
jgi:isoquinoline 1-oxidoreductase subunit alpha